MRAEPVKPEQSAVCDDVGWFDEQLKLRKQHDQEVFDESLLRLADAVLGGREANAHADVRIITKDAIDDILKYYHYKPAQIPDSITDPQEQLAYAMRPHGLMFRKVELEKGWQKDAFGAMIAYRKEDGMPVAVFPGTIPGYWYRDEKGARRRINGSSADQFEKDAICFYRPFPLRKIGIPDLIRYMIGCLGMSDVILLIFLTLIVTIVGKVLPYLSKLLTGFVLNIGRLSLLVGTAIFMIALEVSTQILTASKELGMTRVDSKVSLSVDSALMMRIMSLPVPFFRDYSAGELSSRSEAVNRLCSILVSSIFSIGLTSLMSLLYVTEIFHFAPGFTIPALLVIATTVILSIITTLFQIRISRESMDINAKENGLSYALVTGVRKIRLAGAEKRAFARWADTYSKGARITYNPPLLLKINSAIMLAVSLAGTGVIYFLAVKTRTSPSDYFGFNAAYGAVMGAFMSLTGITSSIAQIKPILEMAEPILKAVPENQENREIVTKLSGSIELNNVYFRYKENMPYVVDGMSLKIRAGEYVALVGRTGCGKSTLMRLLLGFEKPEKGAVYYDGKDINRLDLQSLRRRIGAVTQDGGLFQGDIYSNIVISEPTLSVNDAWEAAEIAGIADDIRAMPMGMHTIIAEGQGGISGGQKQRLMIARAVAPKPRVLMFDEATRALDNKTQKQVSEALDALKCTRLVIAHRLSTIRHCDRIIVLEGGHIIEDGTYEELMAKNGYFAQLVERQRLDIPQGESEEPGVESGESRVESGEPGAESGAEG